MSEPTTLSIYGFYRTSDLLKPLGHFRVVRLELSLMLELFQVDKRLAQGWLFRVGKALQPELMPDEHRHIRPDQTTFNSASGEIFSRERINPIADTKY